MSDYITYKMTFQQFVCIRLAAFVLSIRSLQKCENAVLNVFSMARPGIKPRSFGYKADALTTNPSRRGTIRAFTFGVERIKFDAPSVGSTPPLKILKEMKTSLFGTNRFVSYRDCRNCCHVFLCYPTCL